jgi:alpha-D-ribose 1-methylphosphonate 5-triphosphate diphosphatase
MKKETLFTDALIVTPHEVFLGTVQVQDRTIVAVDRGTSHLPAALKLEGDYLLPGLIELHTDNLEKHVIPRPGVRWPAVAAAVAHDAAVTASGITTVFDAIALGDSRDDSDRIRALEAMVDSVKGARDADMFRAEHFLHLRCEVCYPQVVRLFEMYADDPLVKLVSLMDHTPGQRQFTKIEKFYQYYQGKFNLNEAEMEEMVRRRKENQKQFGAGHRTALVKMCRERGLPLASHDDTLWEHVVEAAEEGIVLSEFPTTIPAAEKARDFGMEILMGAPNLVLGQSHSGNVSATDLAARDLLDILSSDYVPMSLLHGAFRLHHGLGWTLPKAIRVVSANPARIANLQDRGTLETGKRGDFIQVKDDDRIPIIKRIWREGVRIG